MNKNNNATHLKKEILVRVIKSFLSDDFAQKTRLIPYDMRPKGSEVPFRCCIYKERAILKDRIIAALGFAIEADDETSLLSDYAKKALKRKKPEENVLTVLEAACKGCVPSRVFVTDLCQGCVARPCQNSCSFGAITIKEGKSVIDGTKCRNCGKCIHACPYNAIVKIVVPCENVCPVDAISKDESGYAKIDFDKCINCGKCVAKCPFGAVHEKSQIIDILSRMKSGKEVVAMIAPSIIGQLPFNFNQLKTAIRKAGFSHVIEVAIGADITIQNEAKEFVERMEKGESFMTTSCCAGYNELVNKHLEEMKPFISNTKTPLYYTAEKCKKDYKDCITVFISPCVAKRKESLNIENIDYVMNFEELGALFVAKHIEIAGMEPTKIKTEASKEARNFGISGGVSESINIATGEKYEVKPVIINGLNKQTIKELKSFAQKETCDGNLIEVMCCEGGCVGGNACLNNVKTATSTVREKTKESKSIG